MTHTSVDELRTRLRELLAKATPGPWTTDGGGHEVRAADHAMKICDIRGWGYLTGKGHLALGLPDDEAIAIQTANAALIVEAINALPILLGSTPVGSDGERDKIVAWLRGQRWREGPDWPSAFSAAADAIERGEHLAALQSLDGDV